MKTAHHRAASGDASAKSSASAPHSARRVAQRRSHGPRLPEASRQAKRLAAALLEVLAGALSPSDAAALLDISLPKFYVSEQRALEAFIAACEPRPTGRATSPKRQLDLLQQQVERLQRESIRNHALLRAAQRSIGLVPVLPAPAANGKLAAKLKRKRRPTARALVAARTLRSDVDTAGGSADESLSMATAMDNSCMPIAPDVQSQEIELGKSNVQNPNA